MTDLIWLLGIFLGIALVEGVVWIGMCEVVRRYRRSRGIQ